MSETRHYGALYDTHRQVEEQRDATVAPEAVVNVTPVPARDENSQAQAEQPTRNDPPEPSRQWSSNGDMVSQQRSANNWVSQNREYAELRQDAEAARQQEAAEKAQELDQEKERDFAIER